MEGARHCARNDDDCDDDHGGDHGVDIPPICHKVNKLDMWTKSVMWRISVFYT